MGLGDKPAALALAEQAMAANPAEKDVVNGGFALEILARVAAQTGSRPRNRRFTETILGTVFGAFTTAPLIPALLRSIQCSIRCAAPAIRKTLRGKRSRLC